jgi:hypothetical protein
MSPEKDIGGPKNFLPNENSDKTNRHFFEFTSTLVLIICHEVLPSVCPSPQEQLQEQSPLPTAPPLMALAVFKSSSISRFRFVICIHLLS